MSRQELADACNAELARRYAAQGRHSRWAGFTEKTIGALERGEIRWPNDDYRTALCEVLNADGRALGLYIDRAAEADHENQPEDALRESPRRVLSAVSTGRLIHGGSIAICGSRRPGTDLNVIDAAVQALGGILMNGTISVSHGPVGVGIEVMTYIANNFRPSHLQRAVGIFGHANVVHGVDTVIFVGGGRGTQDELDLVLAAGTPMIPIARSGGAARRAYMLMEGDIRLRQWISTADFTALGACSDVATITETTLRLITDRLQGDAP
ncbi:hypothetical protein Cci01nite_71720 [Catellatospora citrea]|uniref:Uncharacterized protein n=1 Tax=Catellatospora citrea TaxID=53366 RepID=A0A8J3KRI4_9ACTN|nr:hypothetical protein [Catellatospora citrea]GIG02079.1 hypothetical protein Cci01nite_71720 [Catellatospora citrea]